MPFVFPGLATLASVIGCASACVNPCACISWASWVSWESPEDTCCGRRRGGSLRPIWALIPRHSLRGLPLVGTPGGNGSGSYCRGDRIYRCKQLTHGHQVIVVMGNDDWGGTAWKE